jgi:hypothetical protein
MDLISVMIQKQFWGGIIYFYASFKFRPLKIGLDYVYVKRSGNHEVKLSFRLLSISPLRKAALNVEML